MSEGGFVLWEFSICGGLECSFGRMPGDEVAFFLKSEWFLFAKVRA